MAEPIQTGTSETKVGYMALSVLRDQLEGYVKAYTVDGKFTGECRHFLNYVKLTRILEQQTDPTNTNQQLFFSKKSGFSDADIVLAQQLLRTKGYVPRNDYQPGAFAPSNAPKNLLSSFDSPVIVFRSDGVVVAEIPSKQNKGNDNLLEELVNILHPDIASSDIVKDQYTQS